jgi:2,5-diketo-D-gluconate reductase B
MKNHIREEQVIPAIGLGTYEIKGPEAISLFTSALDIGYRHIDTAQLYDNEKEVGAAIRQSAVPRSDIFLTTKVWPTRLSKDDFLPSVEDSLRKLQTDYVDLLLIHWPNADIPLSETIPELIKAKEQGKARHVGVSNFPIDLLARAMGLGAPIICNQVEYHPYIDQSVLKGWMDHNDILLTAYSPLAQARVFRDQQLQDYAKALNKSIAQIVLRWLLDQQNVMAIPKSSNVDRLQANLEIFDFELPEEVTKVMNDMSQSSQRFVRSGNDPDWD